MTEENERSSSVWTWAVVIGLCVFLLVWGLLNYVLIRDEPRRFDLNTLPDVPGESVYSSEGTPTDENVPRQTPALPEAVPMSPVKDPRPPDAPRHERKGP